MWWREQRLVKEQFRTNLSAKGKSYAQLEFMAIWYNLLNFLYDNPFWIDKMEFFLDFLSWQPITLW